MGKTCLTCDTEITKNNPSVNCIHCNEEGCQTCMVDGADAECYDCVVAQEGGEPPDDFGDINEEDLKDDTVDDDSDLALEGDSDDYDD